MEEKKWNKLTLKKLGIDTYKHSIVYLRKACHVCQSEGFGAQTRIQVSCNGKTILATLNTIDNGLLNKDEASLSNHAFEILGAKEGDEIEVAHPKSLLSLSHLRSKIYGNTLSKKQISQIIQDITHDDYSEIEISAFLTACAGGRLTDMEIISLTEAMVETGEKLNWQSDLIVDKHCVGGLPGNRTTLIVVPIVASYGLKMPKTSSRAITSPAGTADTMETLAPVTLSLNQMKDIVEKENGCIVWGGGINISPADDILIGVERVLDLDSEGQLIASVLSKKISAGSNHIVIDIPIGPTAKVRSYDMAKKLKSQFLIVAKALNIKITVIFSDGSQPVGRGIGPALEAYDVLAVLQDLKDAPQDLKQRALEIAGYIIEFDKKVKQGDGLKIATQILEDKKAWDKFQAICEAQGGMRTPPIAKFVHTITATEKGRIVSIDNRQLSRLAKLAGAPNDKAAGVKLLTPLQETVEKGQPLFEIHASAQGELRYALTLLDQVPNIIQVEALN